MSSATRTGYHYLNEFQKCPRKFYIRHILKLQPLKTKIQLIFGDAWHQALEEFLQTGNPGSSAEVGLAVLASRQSEMELGTDFESWADKMIVGIPAWAQAWQEQCSQYSVDALEIELKLPMDGWEFTGRLDGIVHDREGRQFVLEHKTTSWSTEKTVQSVELGDQVTGYYALFNNAENVHRSQGRNLDGILLDVTEFKSGTAKTSFWIITRTVQDQANFLLSMQGVNDVIEAMEYGLKSSSEPFTNPFYMFPRNSEFCGMFGCEYEDICRRRLEELNLDELEGFKVEHGND